MPIWNEHNLLSEVKAAVAAGKFQHNTAAIEDLIFAASKIFLDKALPDNVTNEIDVTGLPNLPLAINDVGHPDEALYRNIVFSALFRAWMLGKDKYPTVNNKNYPASPFVIFAEPILVGLGIGKIEDHLEEFRSYRKRAFNESGFEVVRGKVN